MGDGVLELVFELSPDPGTLIMWFFSSLWWRRPLFSSASPNRGEAKFRIADRSELVLGEWLIALLRSRDSLPPTRNLRRVARARGWEKLLSLTGDREDPEERGEVKA